MNNGRRKYMMVDNSNVPFEQAIKFVRYTNRNIFITGRAGTGKTTFLKTLQATNNIKSIVLAPTGVAAINAGASTIHSFFQLPFILFLSKAESPPVQGMYYTTKELLVHVKWNAEKKALVRELELIIIDEISMVRADLLDAIDILLRYHRGQPSLPFGGVQMIFIGDLFQLPPVVPPADWQQLKSIYQSPFFFSAEVIQRHPLITIELSKIYRQTDQHFVTLLNHIRENACTPQDLTYLNEKYHQGSMPAGVITLTSHNAKADAINQQQLKELPGEATVFEAILSGEFPEKNYPVDKSLLLKLGALIMLVKNDAGQDRKYYNGKMGVIEKIEPNALHVRFSGEPLFVLTRETWSNTKYQLNSSFNYIESIEIGSFKQFPVQLAWAVTIHKSQGLTFEQAIVDAGQSFSSGQVYVGLSRLTSLDGLYLRSLISPHAISCDPVVVNYYRSLQQQDLEHILTTEMQLCLFKRLLACFAYDAILSNNPSLAILQPVNNLLEKVRGLADTASKFTTQLSDLFEHKPLPEFAKVTERTQAAVAYFKKETDELIILLQTQLSGIKSGKAFKDLSLAIRQLISSLAAKGIYMDNAILMAKGLNCPEEMESIHQKLLQSNEASVIQLDAPVPVRLVKKRTSVTENTTLGLFKTGNSLAEIAQKRKMALTTIELHLIGFIETGEVPVSALVEAWKLKVLLSHINETNHQSPGDIKSRLEGNFTYGEIRAAIAHWKNLSS